PNQTVAAGAVLTLPVQATDDDGDPVVFSVTGLPAFATFTDNGNGNGQFVFAPVPDDRGNITMTLTATDNGDGGGPGSILSGPQSSVLRVPAPTGPPHLAPIGDKVAVVGQPFQLTLSARDGDQDSLPFGALGLPATASLTPSAVDGQAVITWTPTLADLGQRFAVIATVADDGNGGTTPVL